MIKINLLPPELKQEIDQAKKNAKSLSLFAKTTLLVGLVALITLGTYFALSITLKNTTDTLKTNQTSIEKYGSLEEKAKKTAERINTIKAIDARTYKWSGVVEEIQKIIPSGVYLTEIKMDATPKGRNQLSGNAVDKKAVASLRDAMEASAKFEYVDIESSNTITDNNKREVEKFTLTFSLSKEALK